MPRAVVSPGHPHVSFVGDASREGVLRPPAGSRDLPSILLVEGMPADRDVEELAILEEAGRHLREWFDARVGGTRFDASLVTLAPEADGRWRVRKAGWERPESLPSLRDAVAFTLGKAYGVAQPETDEVDAFRP